MAELVPLPMTRASSTDSSALSNINVANAMAGAEEDASDRVSKASTPPTSLPDAESASMSVSSTKKETTPRQPGEQESARRPKRARAGPSTYNLKTLSDAQLPAAAVAPAGSSRNVSGLTGRTLVEGAGEEERRQDTPLGAKVEKAMDVEWEIPAVDGETIPAELPPRVQRRPSVREKVKKAAGRVGSVLGKRGREVVEKGKRGLGRSKARDEDEDEDEQEQEEEVPRWKKALDMGPKGLLDELDLDVEVEMPAPPPAKKARLSKVALQELSQPPAAPGPLAKAATASKKMKKWQKEGLFVGQDPDFDPTQPGGKKKLQKKNQQQRPGSSASTETAATPAPPPPKKPRQFMPLPMFSYLDKDRPFTIPFDVFAPSLRKGDEKPRDWHQVNKNRLVGEAKQIWEKQTARLPASMCVCAAPTQEHEGCGEDCLNRVMQYECNDDNCNVGALACGNRNFASLGARMKDGGAFSVGVEVVRTGNRGFGVRSCRTWAPGEIVMEYTGEIVSEGECQRRMREEYKDKMCYYLMELERGLIIDGTKGSMARFINHSCEPNCEVRMVKVNGTPRMGVFAGERGVATGEELTYDYNFDNFGESLQKCFCGAPTCRGYLSKRLNASEQKKLARLEGERKRKAAEEAQRHAEDEERRKKTKTERGSNWRGWVAVDDPETKARLKREKAEREEAARGSERARRLAARGGAVPALAAASATASPVPSARPSAKKANGGARKRKSPAVEKQQDVVRAVEADGPPTDAGAPAALDSEEDAPPAADEAVMAEDLLALAASPAKKPRKALHKRAPSSSASKFTEDLPRPTSVQSTSTIARKTEISIMRTETAEVQRSASMPGALTAPTEGETGANEVKKKRGAPIKEAMKSGLQAVKNGLLGAAGKSSSSSSSGRSEGEGKAKGLKQSTLSFTRAA